MSEVQKYKENTENSQAVRHHHFPLTHFLQLYGGVPAPSHYYEHWCPENTSIRLPDWVQPPRSSPSSRGVQDALGVPGCSRVFRGAPAC